MNLILFAANEVAQSLPSADPRAQHILRVLRRRTGDTFDAGLINGPRGKGTLVAVHPDFLDLVFQWGALPPPPDPISLLVGLPRPQTARAILRDATSLGVAALHFVATEKGEPGYLRSTLWQGGEWHRQLLAGAAQAFCTRLPSVTFGQPLMDAISTLTVGGARIVLDNYTATQPLSRCALPRDSSIALAFGPERGWSDLERTLLRTRGFAFAHLGPRVLRAETAVVAALTLLKSKLGSL